MFTFILVVLFVYFFIFFLNYFYGIVYGIVICKPVCLLHCFVFVAIVYNFNVKQCKSKTSLSCFLIFVTICCKLKSPWSSMQCVGLLDAKDWVRIPCQSSKMQQNFESKKPALKKFLKNLSFGVDIELQVPPFTYKIKAHNMSGVRSQAIILTDGL